MLKQCNPGTETDRNGERWRVKNGLYEIPFYVNSYFSLSLPLLHLSLYTISHVNGWRVCVCICRSLTRPWLSKITSDLSCFDTFSLSLSLALSTTFGSWTCIHLIVRYGYVGYVMSGGKKKRIWYFFSLLEINAILLQISIIQTIWMWIDRNRNL